MVDPGYSPVSKAVPARTCNLHLFTRMSAMLLEVGHFSCGSWILEFFGIFDLDAGSILAYFQAVMSSGST